MLCVPFLVSTNILFYFGR